MAGIPPPILPRSQCGWSLPDRVVSGRLASRSRSVGCPRGRAHPTILCAKNRTHDARLVIQHSYLGISAVDRKAKIPANSKYTILFLFCIYVRTRFAHKLPKCCNIWAVRRRKAAILSLWTNKISSERLFYYNACVCVCVCVCLSMPMCVLLFNDRILLPQDNNLY